MKNKTIGANRIIFLGLIALGAGYLYLALQLPKGRETLGPGAIPIILAILLIIACVYLFFFEKSHDADENSDDQEMQLTSSHIWLTIGLIVYLMVLPLTGFLITSFIFLIGVFFIYGNRGIIRCTVYSAITTASVYLIFQVILRVPLTLI